AGGLPAESFAVCFASGSGRAAAGIVRPGGDFIFFRGAGVPFFCLVSLAMQSRSVLSPPARRRADGNPTKGRIGQDKVAEGSGNGKHRRISGENPNSPVPLRATDTWSGWVRGTSGPVV